MNSLLSIDSFNEENNNNERFIKIVTRFKKMPNNYTREANTVY